MANYRRVWGDFYVDDAPVQNSKNLIDSGAVYAAIQSLEFSVLPVDKGGTGKTTAQEAADNFIYSLRTGTEQISSDDCEIITGSPSHNPSLLDRFYKRPVSTIWNYIRKKIAGVTVNVHQSDSNADTSSFAFVNNHVYHLTVSLIGSGFSINTPSSGIGYILAYIGSSATANHYASRQNINIQNGVITTDDIRLPIDWKAESINGSSDNKLHIVVRFNGTSYSFTQSNYELMLVGTDFDGA